MNYLCYQTNIFHTPIFIGAYTYSVVTEADLKWNFRKAILKGDLSVLTMPQACYQGEGGSSVARRNRKWVLCGHSHNIGGARTEAS